MIKVSQMQCAVLLCWMINLIPGQAQPMSQPNRNYYKKAVYHESDTGIYMKNWLLAGPFLMNKASSEPNSEDQLLFFNEDKVSPTSAPGELPPIQKEGYSWHHHASKMDIIDLNSQYSAIDYASAYALASIQCDNPKTVILEIGSDDGLKVWHNGQLIFKHWTSRSVTSGADIIPLHLAKGSNEILLKVQDKVYGWGFRVRILSRAQLSERLISSASRGSLKDVELLLDAGADIKAQNSIGLSALSVARISGKEEVVDLLIKRGAVVDAIPEPHVLTDRLLKSSNGFRVPGAVVLIAREGEVVYTKALGYTDIKNSELVNGNTAFRIASVSKQFTAAAILKLREDGYLQLSDPLSKFIPHFPRGNEVTLHQLLTHTSGVPNYIDKLERMGLLRAYKKARSPISKEELLNFFMNEPYQFEPGKDFRYNNSGYFLLYYIIEKVTGLDYEQYLKETFFQPLGINNTGVHDFPSNVRGYLLTKSGSYRKIPKLDISWAQGGGSLYSTAEDLYRWSEALFGGKVLSEKTLEEAFTPVEIEGKNRNYGYGWFLNTYRGLKVSEHEGNMPGFSSMISRYPTENLTVVILSNGTISLAAYAHQIAEFYLWEELRENDPELK